MHEADARRRAVGGVPRGVRRRSAEGRGRVARGGGGNREAPGGVGLGLSLGLARAVGGGVDAHLRVGLGVAVQGGLVDRVGAHRRIGRGQDWLGGRRVVVLVGSQGEGADRDVARLVGGPRVEPGERVGGHRHAGRELTVCLREGLPGGLSGAVRGRVDPHGRACLREAQKQRRGARVGRRHGGRALDERRVRPQVVVHVGHARLRARRGVVGSVGGRAVEGRARICAHAHLDREAAPGGRARPGHRARAVILGVESDGRAGLGRARHEWVHHAVRGGDWSGAGQSRRDGSLAVVAVAQRACRAGRGVSGQICRGGLDDRGLVGVDAKRDREDPCARFPFARDGDLGFGFAATVSTRVQPNRGAGFGAPVHFGLRLARG